MTLIDDVDLDIYCGRVGNLYIRHDLCPPFELRRIASDWKANGIALSHIVAVIDRHLNDHRRRYYSGSSDALFTRLDEVVRKTWYGRQVSRPPAPSSCMIQRAADHRRVYRHEVDPKRGPNNRETSMGGRADQATLQSAKSIGKKRRGPKRIDQAIAFLRRELADGEVAVTFLEEKATVTASAPHGDKGDGNCNTVERPHCGAQGSGGRPRTIPPSAGAGRSCRERQR